MTINVLPELMLRLRAKQRQVLAWLICLAPLGYLALFYSLVLRARLALGYWPQPYQPDPKELGFSIHHMATLLGLPLWMASPIAVLLLVILWPRPERRQAATPVLFFALTYLAIVQAAWAAVKVKKSYLSSFYHRLAGRRGAKRAIFAVAHRMLTAVYHMLTKREAYHDLGATYPGERNTTNLIKRTVRRLEQLGYKVNVEPIQPATA